MLVENDIYGDLRYAGEPVPPLKQLDEDGGTVLLRSFSKIAFPGLRVGWVVGPKPLIAPAGGGQAARRSAYRPAFAGGAAAVSRIGAAGGASGARGGCRAPSVWRRRWRPAAQSFPRARVFTRPQGGMNLWVELPPPLDAGELLARAQREKVAYLPGKYFAVSRAANQVRCGSVSRMWSRRASAKVWRYWERSSLPNWKGPRTGSRYPAPAVV